MLCDYDSRHRPGRVDSNNNPSELVYYLMLIHRILHHHIEIMNPDRPLAEVHSPKLFWLDDIFEVRLPSSLSTKIRRINTHHMLHWLGEL